jgi:hypothetical protein
LFKCREFREGAIDQVGVRTNNGRKTSELIKNI